MWSFQSMVVRWEPPPLDAQNGVILGYKIKLRKTGKGKALTYTTTANERHYSIKDLERASQYQIRLWATNINGSGPPSDWIDVSTFQNDLIENVVPDEPSDLKCNSIFSYFLPKTKQSGVTYVIYRVVQF